jgi:tryptophan 2,3-dioxygenase
MTRDRRTALKSRLWRAQRDERPSSRSSWQPSFRDESRDWSRQLSEEMRPLVESLQRLRDRGLLE